MKITKQEAYDNESRIIIVSNRLPFTVTQDESSIKFQPAAGGLPTSLNSYLQSLSSDKKSSLWVGWPGSAIAKKDQGKVFKKSLKENGAHPIFISEKLINDFYFGFCNQILWPLFHNFNSYCVYKKRFWEAYKKVNQKFCNELSKLIKPNDIVFIQDYHLMLLPKLLRERCPDAKIGFFLHTPFPSVEVFQLLPKEYRHVCFSEIDPSHYSRCASGAFQCRANRP